jgi:hypothetical protein
MIPDLVYTCFGNKSSLSENKMLLLSFLTQTVLDILFRKISIDCIIRQGDFKARVGTGSKYEIKEQNFK